MSVSNSSNEPGCEKQTPTKSFNQSSHHPIIAPSSNQSSNHQAAPSNSIVDSPRKWIKSSAYRFQIGVSNSLHYVSNGEKVDLLFILDDQKISAYHESLAQKRYGIAGCSSNGPDC